MTIGSHWPTCWKDSSEHWECAVYRIEQLELGIANSRLEVKELQKALAAYEGKKAHD